MPVHIRTLHYWLQYSLQIRCDYTSQSLHAPIAACSNITAYHDTNYFNLRMKYWVYSVQWSLDDLLPRRLLRGFLRQRHILVQ